MSRTLSTQGVSWKQADRHLRCQLSCLFILLVTPIAGQTFLSIRNSYPTYIRTYTRRHKLQPDLHALRLFRVLLLGKCRAEDPPQKFSISHVPCDLRGLVQSQKAQALLLRCRYIHRDLHPAVSTDYLAAASPADCIASFLPLQSHVASPETPI